MPLPVGRKGGDVIAEGLDVEILTGHHPERSV
jgi:hypothetical protein